MSVFTYTRLLLLTVCVAISFNIAAQELSEEQILKGFKASGLAFAPEMNCTAFIGSQKFEFEVLYKNNEGLVKTRRYKAFLETKGLKLQAAYGYHCIFFTQTDFNFYETNKVIEIGSGIDLLIGSGIPLGLGVTYAPFKNAAGGILILTPSLMAGLPFEASMIIGGTLTPVV